jgi:hypothetical protein
LLRNPRENAPFRSLQLRTGRFFGRWYLRFGRIRERLRIQRARIPDRVEPVKASVALVRLQGPLLMMLAGLILVGIACDLLLRSVGVDLARWLGVEGWIRDTFTKPSAATLRDLLGAAAAGTATILGLVISISLIVWQATADRYRSTGIVEFLLRERIGSAVVRLLALGFAYSLWVLAMLELFGHRPYASTAIALVLSTAAVLSLVSYRSTGLLGYVPAGIAWSLRLEIVGELRRATRVDAGRSVEDFSRRVVRGDLQILEDLMRRLEGDGDASDLSACVGELADVSRVYLTMKRELEPDSYFFERHAQRLGDGAMEIEEPILSEGLMDPTSQVADPLWFEKRMLALTDMVVGSRFSSTPSVAEALCRFWSEGLQYSWAFENLAALELILAAAERAGASEAWRSSPALAEQFMTLPWLMVEAVGVGLPTSAERIVDQRPWEQRSGLRGLPWAAREEARALGGRIRAEIQISGEIITPREVMISEVEEHRAPAVAAMSEQMLARATKICQSQLEAAARESSTAGASVVRMTLRTLLRAAHHGLDVPLDHDMAVAIQQCIDQAGGDQESELAADLGRAARKFAETGAWGPTREAVGMLVVTNATRAAGSTDPLVAMGINFETLYNLAILYGWAEFHRWPDGPRTFGRPLQRPFFDFDLLADLVRNGGLHPFAIPSTRQFTWAQPLTQAVNALPDVAIDDGGIGYSLGKDHPSGLFSRIDRVMGGPDFFLRGLIDAVDEERDPLRSELLALLAAYRESREADA